MVNNATYINYTSIHLKYFHLFLRDRGLANPYLQNKLTCNLTFRYISDVMSVNTPGLH